MIPKNANSLVKLNLLQSKGLPPERLTHKFIQRHAALNLISHPQLLTQANVLAALIRDPLDRLHSCWYDKIFKSGESEFKISNPLHIPAQARDFGSFVNYVANTPDFLANHHFASQTFIICGGYAHPNRHALNQNIPIQLFCYSSIDAYFAYLKASKSFVEFSTRPVNQSHKEAYPFSEQQIRQVKQRFAIDYVLLELAQAQKQITLFDLLDLREQDLACRIANWAVTEAV